MPEISNAFDRSGIPCNVVSGMLYEDKEAWREVEEWCRAANIFHTLRGSRFGFLVHTYPGLLDMYSDFIMHHAQLGFHVEILKMDRLKTTCTAPPTTPSPPKRRRPALAGDGGGAKGSRGPELIDLPPWSHVLRLL